MLASRAITGMFDVFAISTVRSSSGLPGARVLERLELLEHVGQLVAALAAADVDDHVGVAPLGDLLQQHGLAGAEAAGDRRRAAARDREEQVEHPLAGHERLGCRQPRARPGADGAPASAARARRSAPPTRRDDVARRGTPPPARSTRATPLDIRAAPARDARSRRSPGRCRARRRRSAAPRPRRPGAKLQPRSRLSVRAALPGSSRAPALSAAAAARRRTLRRAAPGRARPPAARRSPSTVVAGLEPAGVLVHLHGRALAVQRDHLSGQPLRADLDEVEHRQPCRVRTSTTGPLTRVMTAALIATGAPARRSAPRGSARPARRSE